MPKVLLAFVFGFFLSSGLLAQIDKLDTSDIRRTTLEIKSNLSTYQKVEKVHSATDDKYVYTKEEEIKLITIKTLDKGIEKHVSWFYSKGQLIYTEQFWIDIATKNIIDNEKCYLRNGQLIAWVNTEN